MIWSPFHPSLMFHIFRAFPSQICVSSFPSHQLFQFTFQQPNTILIVQTKKCTFLKLFILVKRSTCFGRSFHPSSGAQNCTYSNRYMSNSCWETGASCWLYYKNILWCTDLWTSNLILVHLYQSSVIKFTTLSLFGSDCFATRRSCVVHYAVHGIRIKQLYTGSSHSSVDDSTLLRL
jgi:hypothetical protein